MYALIALAAWAALVAYALYCSKRSNNASSTKHTPLSPYERVIDAAEFKTLVIENSKRVPVLVDFYADWCQPCHDFGPTLSEMAKSCDGSFLLAKVDFDQNKQLAAAYGVTSPPAIALFRNGERVDDFSGSKLPHSLRFFLVKNGVSVDDA